MKQDQKHFEEFPKTSLFIHLTIPSFRKKVRQPCHLLDQNLKIIAAFDQSGQNNLDIASLLIQQTHQKFFQEMQASGEVCPYEIHKSSS